MWSEWEVSIEGSIYNLNAVIYSSNTERKWICIRMLAFLVRRELLRKDLHNHTTLQILRLNRIFNVLVLHQGSVSQLSNKLYTNKNMSLIKINLHHLPKIKIKLSCVPRHIFLESVNFSIRNLSFCSPRKSFNVSIVHWQIMYSIFMQLLSLQIDTTIITKYISLYSTFTIEFRILIRHLTELWAFQMPVILLNTVSRRFYSKISWK